MRFRDRREAGTLLAKQLAAYGENMIVLAIPHGGIPVGYEVAKYMHSPLSIIGVRKIGSPWDPEFAIGAIAEKNITVLDNDIIEREKIPSALVRNLIQKEKIELKRRIQLYRKVGPFPDVTGKTIIIIDDGLATGLTAKAAILSVSQQHPKSIMFASPVCATDSLQQLLTVVDNIVCLITPENFEALGKWYEDFSSVSDEEAIKLIEINNEENYGRVRP